MRKILIITTFFFSIISLFADDYTVITYHQPGLVEAVGKTAVGLTAAVGSTAVGLTSAVGSTAVGLTKAVGETAVGLVTGHDQTFVIPSRPQVIYQRTTTPVYYSYPAQRTQVIVPPGYYGSYRTYTTTPVVYTTAPVMQYVGGNAYYVTY